MGLIFERMDDKKKAKFIAIGRHDGNNLEAVKVWKLIVDNKSLHQYFETTNPGREIVTEGGHIQFRQVENLKITSPRGNWDPIFGIGGNLVFNWWYSNNGVRICLDGGHLSKSTINDDGTHGLGNEFSADTENGQGSSYYWHDVANIQGPCYGVKKLGPCECQGTDHGTGMLSSVKLGQYVIFVSQNSSAFPWN